MLNVAPAPNPTRRAVLRVLGTLGGAALAAEVALEATEHVVSPPGAVGFFDAPLAHPAVDARPALARRFPRVWAPDGGGARLRLFDLRKAPVAVPVARAGRGPLGDRLYPDGERHDGSLLPWLPLFDRPLPVGPLPATLGRALGLPAALWRDEGAAPVVLAGNKARKYEYTLANALYGGAARISTIASSGSNHAVALSFAARLAVRNVGRAEPLAVNVRSYPQAETRDVVQKQKILRALGVRVTAFEGDVRAALAIAGDTAATALGLLAADHFVVPAGGSSPVAVLGHIDAALELAEDLVRAGLPRPDDVFVALGSGATAVGLALGFALLGWPTRVVATLSQDKPRWLSAALYGDSEIPLAVAHARRLAESAGALLDGLLGEVLVEGGAALVRRALAPEHFVVDADTWRPAYGVASPAVKADLDVAATHGLILDATFAGKSFSTMCQWARAGRLQRRIPLLWQTFHRFDYRRLLGDMA
jgi:D-cysteine desulfhydrase